MNQCPHCGRKLLSRASSCCNWCGKEIEDVNYQAQAQTEREAFFAHQAAHDAQSLANARALNANTYDPMQPAIPLINGPLLGFDPRPTTARRAHSRQDEATRRAVEQALAEQQKTAVPNTTPLSRNASGFPQRPGPLPTAPPPADDETPEEAPEAAGARFSHLEL